jgi:hypothetical protein
VIVEIQDWDHVVVHTDVADTVDNLLRNFPIAGEVRTRDESGAVHVEEQRPERAQLTSPEVAQPRRPMRSGLDPSQSLQVYPFGVSRNRLEQAVRELHVPVTVARQVEDADLVLTLKNYYRRKPEPLRDAESQGTPIYVLKSNTVGQMQSCLASVFNLGTQERDSTMTALEEAEQAVGEVIERSRTIEVAPQNAHVRRLQHQLAERYNVGSRSRGRAKPPR